MRRIGACAPWPRQIGISHTSVQRIWAEAGLKPHLMRKFKLSNDPKFEEKVTRRRGSLHEPAGQGVGAVRRREEPDPGARPHAAGPAYEEGPRGDNDARLQAPRHNDAVRRFEREDRAGHWRMSAPPSRQGIHPVPEEDRPDREPSISISTSSSTTTRRTRQRKFRRGWSRHPRFKLHFIPTSSSWLNLVERFFAEITRQAHPARRLQERRRVGGRHR